MCLPSRVFCVLSRCCPRLLHLSARIDADGGMPPNRILIELVKRCSSLLSIDIRASPAQNFLNDSSLECLASLLDLEVFRASDDACRVSLSCLQDELPRLTRLHFFEPFSEDASAGPIEHAADALALMGFHHHSAKRPHVFLRRIPDPLVHVALD